MIVKFILPHSELVSISGTKNVSVNNVALFCVKIKVRYYGSGTFKCIPLESFNQVYTVGDVYQVYTGSKLLDSEKF